MSTKLFRMTPLQLVQFLAELDPGEAETEREKGAKQALELVRLAAREALKTQDQGSD